MSQKIYGYMRVSTREQNEDRQRLAMIQYGVPEENIVLDKKSGKDFERPAYQALIARMDSGDKLVIKSIDRLGRNYEEILEQWRILTKERNLLITVLDMPILDTKAEQGLLDRLICEIILHVLSYFAQQEREYIRQRQAEGIAAAKGRGVHFGNTAMRVPQEFEIIYAIWQNGELSATKAAKALGVSRNTFLKWTRR